MAVNPISPHQVTEFRVGVAGHGMRVVIALVLLSGLLLWVVSR